MLHASRIVGLALVLAALCGCEFGADAPVRSCAAPPKCGPNGDPDPIYACSGSRDAYVCQFLEHTVAANEPDPMIFKAQIDLESNFDVFAVSPDPPCGVKAGWTIDESRSFGLMQLTPACGWLKTARLPDGHPNLERDASTDLWSTSVFNPVVNVNDGVQAMQLDRAELVSRFPGCSEADYTMMSLGAFNQGSSSITGCNQMSLAAASYVLRVRQLYSTLASNAAWPDRYH